MHVEQAASECDPGAREVAGQTPLCLAARHRGEQGYWKGSSPSFTEAESLSIHVRVTSWSSSGELTSKILWVSFTQRINGHIHVTGK